jgi:crotonobetainyl-CoA:carnitine CoA-transferase CaiB-like acyl-CoA transferase
MTNIETLYGLVAKAAPSRTTQQWLDICDAHSIPCNPVLDLEDLLEDPHLKAVDFMQVVEHPSVGTYRSVRDPVKYEKLSTSLRRHAPIPGEHTSEVMKSLGWSEARINSLQ